MRSIPLVLAVAALFASPVRAADDEFELAPIEYSKKAPDNRVSRLQAQLESGETKLVRDADKGYLPALLEALDVPVESQLLVFSKTSLQRTRISPRTPRAIYFNDDVYVGYCHAGDVVEISAADPHLGAVFYTLDQKNEAAPALVRQTQSCLQCHASTQVDGIPGLLVRSVYVAASGLPIVSEGSHRVDHTTPLKDRWGGWYVTGQHGSQTHLGNFVVRDRGAARPFDNSAGQNLLDLSDEFRVDNYLSPHSDIVALMVFEHQALVHNLLTKADFEARRALYYEADFNRAFGAAETRRLESTTRRIASAGDKLVEALLFADEAPLSAPIQGTSAYTEVFAKSGPRDSKGRSLRDFDLNTRIFKYPCSYLIYTPAFDGMHAEMKSYVADRLRAILTGGDASDKFARLSSDDRRAVWEILQETKPDLWKP